MLKMRFALGVLWAGLLILSASFVCGQDYPNKPIRIVTLSPGGGLDFAARLIAQGVSGPLGQNVIVDNRGGPYLSGEIVANAPPDGYTLLVSSNNLWLTPVIQSNVPYDPVRDFSPITMVARSPSILVVHPSVPIKSVKELIALAKARPGALNYASGITGGADHLAAELFKAMAEVNIVRIAYKGSGPAILDLLGGHVQMQFGTAGAVAPHIKSGRLTALAVTSVKPFAAFPDLPTVAATLPGYEAVQILGVWAPAKTPVAVINRLNQEIVRAINSPEIKDRFLSSGVEVASGTADLFASIIKVDLAKWSKVIKDAGIREN
jgi:tripartite-type tricarboxylate transporter receptor subunit TctC